MTKKSEGVDPNGQTESGKPESGKPESDGNGSARKQAGRKRTPSKRTASGKLDRSAEADAGNLKADLLATIRSKRSATEELSNRRPARGATRGDLSDDLRPMQGSLPEDDGHMSGNGDVDGLTSRSNRSNGRRDNESTGSNGGTDQNEDEGRQVSKPAGLHLVGMGALPKMPDLPEFKPKAEQKALTEKESKELRPRMVLVLQTVFRYMDFGITATNKAHAEAYIWQTIDPNDCETIAGLLVESGKRSPIMAVAVRKLSLSYKYMQVGIITLPRFLQTYKFYMENGGFLMPGFGQAQKPAQFAPPQKGSMTHAQTKHKQQDLSGGQKTARKPAFVAPAVKEK